MNKKSVIRSIIIGAVIVFAVCFFLYERYAYLPVLGKMIAKSKMEAYAGKSLSVEYFPTTASIRESMQKKTSIYII